jgi:hypothetical protein
MTTNTPLNGSITGALKPGMTEQQVAEVSNNRVPDRVVMTTCGTETPKPFAARYTFTTGHFGAVSTTGNFGSFWRMSEDNGKSANGFDSRVVGNVCAEFGTGRWSIAKPMAASSLAFPTWNTLRLMARTKSRVAHVAELAAGHVRAIVESGQPAPRSHQCQRDA